MGKIAITLNTLHSTSAEIESTDYVVIPLGADLFSLQGLKNLGPTLVSWQNLWKKRLDNWRNSSEANSFSEFQLPQLKRLGWHIQEKLNANGRKI